MCFYPSTRRRPSIARKTEKQETEKKYPSSRAFLISFAAIFFSEWGDVGQMTAVTMAARFGEPLWVWLGAVGAVMTQRGGGGADRAGGGEKITGTFFPPLNS